MLSLAAVLCLLCTAPVCADYTTWLWTGQNEAVLDNSTNNAVALTENSEDIIYTFGTNAITVTSSTGVTSLTFTDIDLTFGTAVITGGTIDGTTIGATTASTGAFTTLSASGNVTLSANLYMPSGGIIDFNSADATITHSTDIGGLLTYAGCHQRMAEAGQWQFRTATQYLRSDSAGSFVVSAQTALHLAIAGTNEIDISATTMAMNANTISECGHIYFNGSAGMIQDEGNTITIYGGNTTGDILWLYGSSANASPNIKITGNDRVLLTGNMAVTGTLNASGLLTLDGGANVANGDVTLAEAHYLSFVSSAHSIRKVGGSLHIVGTEVLISSSGAYINGGFLRMVSTAPIYFDGTSAYIHSTGTGKIAVYCSSTASDAFKIGTGAGGGISFETFLKLHVTDGEGAVEGQIWYDNSENKLKFWNGSAVETVTSAT